MTQQDEEVMMKFFLKAFDEVLVPALDQMNERFDQIDEKLGEHSKKLDELTEKVDTHSASLIELEKLPKLIGEMNGDIQTVKSRQQKLEERFQINGH